MATDERTTGTRDKHYDIVSTLYHALQGAEISATYLQDAERARDPELVQFFRQVQDRYRELADRSKTLLRERLQRPVAKASGVPPAGPVVGPVPQPPPPLTPPPRRDKQ